MLKVLCTFLEFSIKKSSLVGVFSFPTQLSCLPSNWRDSWALITLNCLLSPFWPFKAKEWKLENKIYMEGPKLIRHPRTSSSRLFHSSNRKLTFLTINYFSMLIKDDGRIKNGWKVEGSLSFTNLESLSVIRIIFSRFATTFVCNYGDGSSLQRLHDASKLTTIVKDLINSRFWKERTFFLIRSSREIWNSNLFFLPQSCPFPRRKIFAFQLPH